MNTTFADIRVKGRCERRNWDVPGYTSKENGKSYFTIECPFCRFNVRAYLWSLAGGGKRCDCGAMLTNYGTAFKIKGKEKDKKSCKQKTRLRVSKKRFKKVK